MASQGSLAQLYRALLTLHRSKFPDPLRSVGDAYVRSEFRAHLSAKTTPAQWDQFTAEWLRYHRMLAGEGAAEPAADVISDLSGEQQAKMHTMYTEAQKLRESMIDEAFDKPPPPPPTKN